MLLHTPFAPVASTGHVELSPGVHACVQTWKPDVLYAWQLRDMHWSFEVHGS
jgi:hypothetical protein